MSDSILESAEETFSIQAHPSKGQSQLVNIPADQQLTLVTIVDTNSKCEWLLEGFNINVILYVFNQRPQLLMSSLHILVRLLFNSGYYLRMVLSCKLEWVGVPKLFALGTPSHSNLHDMGTPSWLNAVNTQKSVHPPVWQTCKVLHPWHSFTRLWHLQTVIKIGWFM